MTRACRRQRGLTLVELLLAMAATVFIGAAIAVMLTATSYGTSSSRDMRSLVARGKVGSGRIGAAIRGSRLVLDEGDDFVVLWTRDLDEDDAPSLLEIRRIDFDSATGELSSYEAPDTEPDVLYLLTDDFEAITDALMGGASFPAEKWVGQVSAFGVDLDDPDPQLAELIGYRLTMGSGDLSDTAIGVIRLRN